MAGQEGMRDALTKARAHINPIYGILVDDIRELAPGGPDAFGRIERQFQHGLSQFDDLTAPSFILQALDGAIQTLEVVQGRVEKEIDDRKQVRIRRLSRGPWALVLGIALG